MPRHQQKNTINNCQNNTAEAQESGLKVIFLRVIEVLKQEGNKFLKEREEKTNKKMEEINKFLFKSQEKAEMKGNE